MDNTCMQIPIRYEMLCQERMMRRLLTKALESELRYLLKRAQMRRDKPAWQNTWWQNSEQNQVALHTFPRRSLANALADAPS